MCAPGDAPLLAYYTSHVTLYYLCGSDDAPHGGVFVAYRHVDILNEASIPARIVHGKRNFRCTWFENSSNVVSLPLEVVDTDVLVLPEHWNSLLGSLAPGVPKVSFNQSAFYGLQGYSVNEHPYATSKDLLATLTVSEQNLHLLEYFFPQNRFDRVHLSVDHSVFHLPDEPPGRRIAYMTQKRPDECRMVIDSLTSRGVLKGWEIVPIEGIPQAEVADTLRSTSLFLSFLSQHEGCALSPLEALACGCSVIGYTGFGAREYFEPLGGITVTDGDVVSFAEEVTNWVENFDAGEHWVAARSISESCLKIYSPEQEAADVVSFWRNIQSEMPRSRGVRYTLSRKDVRKGSLRSLIRRSTPYVQAGIRELRAVPRSSARS
jgi:hypothetical protein